MCITVCVHVVTWHGDLPGVSIYMTFEAVGLKVSAYFVCVHISQIPGTHIRAWYLYTCSNPQIIIIWLRLKFQ